MEKYYDDILMNLELLFFLFLVFSAIFLNNLPGRILRGLCYFGSVIFILFGLDGKDNEMILQGFFLWAVVTIPRYIIKFIHAWYIAKKEVAEEEKQKDKEKVEKDWEEFQKWHREFWEKREREQFTQETQSNSKEEGDSGQETAHKDSKEEKFSFFSGCTDKESIRKRYLQLMKIYHPDNQNGDTKTIQQINEEYEKLMK